MAAEITPKAESLVIRAPFPSSRFHVAMWLRLTELLVSSFHLDTTSILPFTPVTK